MEKLGEKTMESNKNNDSLAEILSAIRNIKEDDFKNHAKTYFEGLVRLLVKKKYIRIYKTGEISPVVISLARISQFLYQVVVVIYENEHMLDEQSGVLYTIKTHVRITDDTPNMSVCIDSKTFIKNKDKFCGEENKSDTEIVVPNHFNSDYDKFKFIADLLESTKTRDQFYKVFEVVVKLINSREFSFHFRIGSVDDPDIKQMKFDICLIYNDSYGKICQYEKKIYFSK